MQVADSERDLGAVEARERLVEGAPQLQVVKDLAAAAEGHDEVELVLGLEGEAQPDEEGVVDALEDGALGLRVLNLVARHDDGLVEHLHGQHLAARLVAHLQHLAVRAAADNAQ